jgi:hypothetical protein
LRLTQIIFEVSRLTTPSNNSITSGTIILHTVNQRKVTSDLIRRKYRRIKVTKIEEIDHFYFKRWSKAIP